MAKLLLLSVVIAIIAVPVTMGRGRNHKRELQRTLLYMLMFNIFYLLAIRFIYPRLL